MERKFRAHARKLRNRMVNPHLQMLKQVRDQLIDGVDVLMLSDSTSLWADPEDPDPAMVPELLGRELGGARVAAVAGPGFNAKIHAEILRVLGTLDQRPRYVVTSTSVRTNLCTHVVTHPVYRYQRLLEALSGISDARRGWPRFAAGDTGTPEDYAAFRATTVHSRWTGESTIGAFREQLEGRGPHPWPRELERVLFDYFHGEEIPADHPQLEHCRELGRQIKSYGVPCVNYPSLPPMERGESNFPGEFHSFVGAKQAMMLDAIAETASDWQTVELALADADYIQPADATEHYALSGRLQIARAVVAALPD